MHPTRMPAPSVPNSSQNPDESGFLLMGTAVLIIVVVAMLSSFAFVSSRENRFKSNYAGGERVAELATAAHFFAQWRHYAPAPNVPLDMDAMATALFNSDDAAHPEFNPPDGFKFRSTGGITYSMEIRGNNNAPVNAGVLPALKAASAYMQIKIRVPAGKTITPSDRIAFLAGAASRGMTRVGFVATNIPAGDLCDGAPTRVRWGPERSGCLNAAQIAALKFADVQPGDIIVPTWETALAKASDKMIYRYKQPERPDLNSMNTALLMGATPAAGNTIDGINVASTQNIDSTTGVTTMDNEMIVRNGSATAINQAIVQGNPLRVYNQDAPAAPSMNVAGPVSFTAGDLSINKTLAYTVPARPLNVTVVNNVGIDRLQNESGSGMVIEPIVGSTLNVAIDDMNPASNLTGVTMDNPTAKLAVTGNLDAAAASVDSPYGTNIYAADITFTGTDSNLLGAPPVSVGAIEQTGNSPSQYLRVTGGHKVQANVECHGKGCPDFVTGGSSGGI